MPDEDGRMTFEECTLTLSGGALSVYPRDDDYPTGALMISARRAWLELLIEDGWPRARLYGTLFCDAPGGPYRWRITGHAEREL